MKRRRPAEDGKVCLFAQTCGNGPPPLSGHREPDRYVMLFREFEGRDLYLPLRTGPTRRAFGEETRRRSTMVPFGDYCTRGPSKESVLSTLVHRAVSMPLQR